MLQRNIKNIIFSLQDVWSFIFVLLLFTFSCGNSLPYAEYVGMSLQEYILYVVSDHYYLIYVWFFFLLFWSVRQISSNDMVQRIRYGSNKEYRKVYSLAKSIELLIMILAHILMAFIIGITRLDVKERFFGVEQITSYDSNLEVLLGYAQMFENCIAAMICVVFYWWFGSCFLFRLMFYVHEVWKKKGLYVGLLYILLSGMFGFMSHADESVLEIFFCNNYFILHYVLLGLGILPVVINLCIMWFVPECIERVEKVCVKN